MRDRLSMAGKIGILLVTATLLMATSAPPRTNCDHPAAPVVFRAVGTCGPGGLIVVETQGASSTVAVANAAALGLPPLSPGQGNSGRYLGTACPFTVEKGEWQFGWTCSQSSDGGADDTRGGGGGGTGARLDGPEGSDAPSERSTMVGEDAATADAGQFATVDGGTGGDGGQGLTMSCLQSCVAHLGPNGELLFTCTGALGELLCESRLTKVMLP